MYSSWEKSVVKFNKLAGLKYDFDQVSQTGILINLFVKLGTIFAHN